MSMPEDPFLDPDRTDIENAGDLIVDTLLAYETNNDMLTAMFTLGPEQWLPALYVALLRLKTHQPVT